MEQTTPTVSFDQLFEAMEQVRAESYLNRLTGQIVTFHDNIDANPATRAARQDMQERPGDWLLIPDAKHDPDCVEFRHTLLFHNCLPTFI